MTKRITQTLSLALMLCTSACVATTNSRALPEEDTTDDQLETDAASAIEGGADVAPALPQGSNLVQQDRADCLTFYTAEDGLGSLTEQALAADVNAPRVVFLNRAGGTYNPGRNNSSTNTSSIPDRSVRVAAYEGDDATWGKVVSCVKEQFASYNVQITDRDPGGAPHIEAVVGDGPEALQLGSGVGGISPFTCGVIERSIVYVFSRVLRGVQSECEVIAHEIGHSLGLEHEFLCEDPMTYLHGCGDKEFQDEEAACGTYQAEDCSCGKLKQNTVQKLLKNVGNNPNGTDPGEPPPPPPPTPSDELPKVAVLAPAPGATLPGNADLTVSVRASDDKGVRDVRLLWEFQGTRTLSCNSAQAPVSCKVEGDRYDFTFPVGTGPRAFTAEVVDTANQIARAERVTLELTDGSVVDAAPTVSITSPSANAGLVRGSAVAVRASALDDRGVREVTLIWQGPTGSQTFRLSKLSNETYGVDLTLSTAARAGARTLTVSAIDDAGQTTKSAPVSVQVK